jgi:hypothetical protein
MHVAALVVVGRDDLKPLLEVQIAFFAGRPFDTPISVNASN